LIVAPGSSQTSKLRAPRSLLGGLSWRLLNWDDGTDAIAASHDGIAFDDLADSRGLYQFRRPYTAPDDGGTYRAIWRYGYEQVHETVVVAASSEAQFAEPTDVAARLGRELTAGETETVGFLLTMAAALIADAVGKDDGWVVTLDPVPQVIRGLSVELTVRALANPNQLLQLREQLGSYSMAATFAQDRLGFTLTPVEEMIVRRTVYGRTSGSAPVRSAFTVADEILWAERHTARPIQ
jgi:hypothetical protein